MRRLPRLLLLSLLLAAALQLALLTALAVPCQALTALEFYSGIGGLRAALAQAMAATGGMAHPPQLQVTAYDVNEAANAAYAHAWADAPTCKSIEHLRAADLPPADVWLLSPPCQPFTRQGLQQDTADPRTRSFLHLLQLLEEVPRCPTHVVLENVVGFEGSNACVRLLAALRRRGYAVHQFVLSPTQLGIPNTRTRYYCLAERVPTAAEGSGQVHAVCHTFPVAAPQQLPVYPRTLESYLDHSLAPSELSEYMVEQRVLNAAARGQPLDIATCASTETITFTKGYGKQIGKAGPYLLLEQRRTAAGALLSVSQEQRERFSSAAGVPLLRYFTPQEMLAIAGFPQAFAFAPGMPRRSAYQLIGNSVNVAVVRCLLEWLLHGGGGAGGVADGASAEAAAAGGTR